MPRRALQLMLIGALLLPFARAAEAQIVRACALERQEFCSSVPAGGGRLVRCLRANAAQASGMCQQAMLRGPATQNRRVAMQGAPWGNQAGPAGAGEPTPASPYASGPGMTAMPPGSATASPTGPRPRWILQACAMERQQFCSAVPSGPRRVVRCLDENIAQVSPRCGRALQAGMTPRGGPAGYSRSPGMTPAGLPGTAPPAGMPPAQQQ